MNPDCDDAKGLAALKTSDIARKLRCTRRETETVDVEGSNDGWGWKQTAQQTRREREQLRENGRWCDKWPLLGRV